MYHDEIFDKALKDVKEESYKALMEEVFTIENCIEGFLKRLFESNTFKSERDFNMTAL